jgi:hypothetical protein
MAMSFGGAPDATLEFDDGASPWHTRLRVSTTDRTGLLGDLAAAIAASGLVVHSAEIGTEGALVVDTFEVSGARGRLLADERAALLDDVRRGGVLEAPPRRVHRALMWLRGTWASENDQPVDISTSSG